MVYPLARGERLNSWFGAGHIRITFNRRVISSAGISSPWPDPGQTAQVRSQSCGVRTLLSQNGHVRHCRGRTG
jgi:hypothetical protein